MDEYIEVNRKTYDAAAEEFLSKQPKRHESTLRLVNYFLDSLLEVAHLSPISILELGPGTGHASALLCDRGYEVTAIEFSEPMAKLTTKTAPNAVVINDEFLAHDFQDVMFDGIYAVAFIHLFPAEDALGVVQKIRALLKPGGIALISTTIHPESDEGYNTKLNFMSNRRRYRRQYTRENLEALLISAGMTIREFQVLQDPEESEKTWMNVIVQNNL